jgi:hypothetical protein
MVVPEGRLGDILQFKLEAFLAKEPGGGPLSLLAPNIESNP